MKKTHYEKVIVIGYGVIAKDVLELVKKKQSEYGYVIEYIEHEEYPFSVVKSYAEANDIMVFTIENNNELLAHFIRTINGYEKVLIVSANNNYIFPTEITGRQSVSIINFHNALLPLYPGRNAPSWVIYNDEEKTGITWHYVSDDIDGGDIIVQKEIMLDSDIKAYELVKKQMDVAAEAFDEIYDDVMYDIAPRIKQNMPEQRRIYKSNEVPGDGLIDINGDTKAVYRTLRALDYGKSNIFPLPAAEVEEGTVYIKRYKIVDKEGAENNRRYLAYGNRFLMLVYDIMNVDCNT